jgi:predicted nucleotidyltransferase
VPIEARGLMTQAAVFCSNCGARKRRAILRSLLLLKMWRSYLVERLKFSVSAFRNMKDVEGVKRTLSRHKAELKRKFKVKTIGVFGSYVRGEQEPGSDVDVLVEFEEDAEIGFFGFLDLEEFLSQMLGVKVDLVMKDALKPYIGKRILQEVVMV